MKTGCLLMTQEDAVNHDDVGFTSVKVQQAGIEQLLLGMPDSIQTTTMRQVQAQL